MLQEDKHQASVRAYDQEASYQVASFRQEEDSVLVPFRQVEDNNLVNAFQKEEAYSQDQTLEGACPYQEEDINQEDIGQEGGNSHQDHREEDNLAYFLLINY